MATQKQVISWLEEIIPDIKRTRDPEDVMLKYAREKNLAPAQLEKLAQVYNSAKTINFLEKSANRGDNFHVVDASELLSRYVQPAAEKKASTNLWTQPDSAGLRSFPTATVKSALREEETHSVAPDNTRAVVRNHLQTKEAFNRNAATHEAVVYATRSDVSEKLATLVNKIHQTPDFDFAALERDVNYQANGTAKEACDLLAGALPKVLKIKRASDAGPRRLLVDRSGLIGEVSQLQELISVTKSASALQTEFLKEAARGTAGLSVAANGTEAMNWTGGSKAPVESTPTRASGKKVRNEDDADEEAATGGGGRSDSGGSRGGGDSKPSASSASNLSGELAKMVQGISIPKFPGDPAGFIGDLLSDSMSGRRNKAQEHVDGEHDDLVAKTVMERLLHNDPIISMADSGQVASLANSIRSRSPDLAHDINAMRAELRQAIQYASMPANATKDLVGIQKSINDNAQSQRDMNRDRYSISPSKVIGGGGSAKV